ncbi:MAG: phosphoglycolate phosphatase [Myxococcales bacterium]|nr:phosphoglycolate phosphatase [Myxococcales bacterium]
MPAYGFVILDLDGTLVDSAPDLCAALGRTLGELGLPPPELSAVRSMIGDGQRVLIERALRHAGGPEATARIDEALLRFRAHYGAHLTEHTVPYPGVVGTLARLAREVPLAVATNKPGAWARQMVAELGLSPYLRWVLGEDDVGRRKPDPLLLLTLCDRAGVPLERSLYVGDSLVDAHTAEAAGMDFCLCTWGYGGQGIAAVRARHRLDAFGQLVGVVLGDEPSGSGRATIDHP